MVHAGATTGHQHRSGGAAPAPPPLGKHAGSSDDNLPPPMDAAWDKIEGGEFVDLNFTHAWEEDGVAKLVAAAMANPERIDWDDRRRHKNSTVATRMRQQHGKLLVDTLQSDGLPVPGRGGDPSVKRKPMKLVLERNGRVQGGPSSSSYDHRLRPDDSITQRHREAAGYYRRSSRDDAGSAASSSSSHGRKSKKGRYGSFASRVEAAVKAQRGGRDDDRDEEDDDRHSSHSSARSSSHGHHRHHSDDDDRHSAASRDSSVSRPGRSLRRTKYGDLTGLEGDVTLLERTVPYLNPALRLHAQRLEEQVHRGEREVRRRKEKKDRARRRRARARGRSSESISSASSVSSDDSAAQRLKEYTREVDKETRARYFAFLQEEANLGHCKAPKETATHMELRSAYETLVFREERRQKIARARIVAVFIFHVVDFATRVTGLPLPIQGFGLYMQMSMQSPAMEPILMKFYEKKLKHIHWDDNWDFYITCGVLILGFFFFKMTGEGAGQPIIPGMAPLPAVTPQEQLGEKASLPDNMRDTMSNHGGFMNILNVGMQTAAALSGNGGGGMSGMLNMLSSVMGGGAGLGAPSGPNMEAARQTVSAADAAQAQQTQQPGMGANFGGFQTPTAQAAPAPPPAARRRTPLRAGWQQKTAARPVRPAVTEEEGEGETIDVHEDTGLADPPMSDDDASSYA